MIVTIEMFGETEKFLLGNREIGGDTDLDVYSEKSPLGAALLGKAKGDEVEYETPNGKVVKVKIIDAVPYDG